jgi:hypothetical protein
MSERYEMLEFLHQKEHKMTYPIEERNQLIRLVQRLLNHERREPIVVITTHRHELDPFVNAQLLQEELTGMADVYLLAESVFPHFAKRISNQNHCPVQGDIHLYAPKDAAGIAAQRFECNDLDDWPRITSQLIDLIQPMNWRNHPLIYLPISGHWQEGKARVEEVLSKTRARVSLDTGGSATMLSVEVKPGIPAQRLLCEGQEFTGKFGTGIHHRTFAPSPVHDDVAIRARKEFPQKSVVLARVCSVKKRRATLEIHPELTGEMKGGIFHNLSRTLTRGEVVRVSVSWKRDGCVLALTEHDGAVGAMSVIPLGPPWLEEPQDDQRIAVAQLSQAASLST